MLYPIAFSLGNTNPLPFELQLRAAFGDSPNLHGAIGASVPLNVAQHITGAADITPFMGVILNHDEGDSVMDLALAQEHLPDLAELYTEFTGQPWQPKPFATMDLAAKTELLDILAVVLNTEWRIEPDFADVEQLDPARFETFLQPA